MQKTDLRWEISDSNERKALPSMKSYYEGAQKGQYDQITRK
jgi:hypothetical protein